MIRRDKLHIIIIEPDANVSGSLATHLGQLGVQHVQQTQHFRNLQKIVGATPFDLVILGDGFEDAAATEALRFVQHFPATKNVPVIWLADNKTPADAREMISQGVSEVLERPIEESRLQKALHNFFRRVGSKEIRSLITKAPFFEGFSDRELAALAKVAIPRRFSAGETIIRKGEPADEFFVLLKGHVEILSFNAENNPVTIMITEGHSFGEMAMLDGSPRSAFAIAAQDCLALSIGSQIIRDPNYLLTTKIISKITLSLAAKLRRMNGVSEQLYKRIAELEDRIEELEAMTDFPDGASLSQTETAQRYTTTPATEGQSHVAETSEPEEPAVEEEEAPEPESPFANPTGTAEAFDESVSTQEDYDVLQRKVNLRIDFITAKVPNVIGEVLTNKLFGYLTGSKLAKMNPHQLWSPKWFTQGTPRLKHSLHLVAACANGMNAYQESYLDLPLTQRLIGRAQTGCAGTFLGSDEAIDRYLSGQDLALAPALDFEMPIDRVWNGKDVIEFLTHTDKDVRPNTLFVLFDTVEGSVTRRFRERFPEHQMLTVVHDYSFDHEELSTFFTMPEEDLIYGGYLVPKKDWTGKGFYLGETFFLPDLSPFFLRQPALEGCGYMFATIGLLTRLGPDYSGITWGSKGGADGAVRAARALYGIKGAQSSKDLANAVNWADA